MRLVYEFSPLEARALRALSADPPAVWFKKRLATVVANYVAAGGADVADIKDRLDRADAATVERVKTALEGP